MLAVYGPTGPISAVNVNGHGLIFGGGVNSLRPPAKHLREHSGEEKALRRNNGTKSGEWEGRRKRGRERNEERRKKEKKRKERKRGSQAKYVDCLFGKLSRVMFVCVQKRKKRKKVNNYIASIPLDSPGELIYLL